MARQAAARADIVKVKKTLKAERPAPRIEPVLPSLEDVFVSLIEARDRAEAPVAEVRR